MPTKRKRTPAKNKSKKDRVRADKPAPNLLDRLPKNDIERVEMLIRMDRRNIDGSGSSVDQLFEQQLRRHLTTLDELKGKK